MNWRKKGVPEAQIITIMVQLDYLMKYFIMLI